MNRFERGLEKLKEVDGEAGENVIENLKDISPDLGKFIIEYAFGDVYSRRGLDLKAKEIAVVAALTAMGTALPQLKIHINGALNTGSSICEVQEVILQMSSYSGFPSCINGMNALKDVLISRKNHGIKDCVGKQAKAVNNSNRFDRGVKSLTSLDHLQVQHLKETYGSFCPELISLMIEYGYGDIYSRDNLDIKLRQVATIAALTALGAAQPQLAFHIKAGLNIGLTKENIEDTMILMSVYSGFPSAINGMNILKTVVNSRGEE